jgi:hypothetical protein
LDVWFVGAQRRTRPHSWNSLALGTGENEITPNRPVKSPADPRGESPENPLFPRGNPVVPSANPVSSQAIRNAFRANPISVRPNRNSRRPNRPAARANPVAPAANPRSPRPERISGRQNCVPADATDSADAGKHGIGASYGVKPAVLARFGLDHAVSGSRPRPPGYGVANSR